MHVTLVHIHVTNGKRNVFIEACRINHLASIKEPGNCRFDILESPDDPDYFLLYEAYASADSAAAHKKTEHYQRWRETVADWMAEPRKGVQFTALYPQPE